MVRFSDANTKIKKLLTVPALQKWLENKRKVYSFDLLSGWSCPFAEACLSKAIIVAKKRKIKDGPKTEFRCFSASQEVQYDGVYEKRKHNDDLMKTRKDSVNGMYELLAEALPENAGIVRIHVSGDFFNLKYLLAWIMLAKRNPHILFYAYTKSLPYWIECSSELQGIPNLVLTASYGGRHDGMIAGNFRSAKVVFSQEEADKRGLIIDSDDSHAAVPEWRNNDFALLIHGTQPKGSESGKALVKIKRANKLKKELAK